MRETEDDLIRLNREIPDRENAGNRKFFRDRLAAAFAIRRASGAIEARAAFLRSLKPGGSRTCDARSIRVSRRGSGRAIVDCVVRVDGKAYLNTRLFVRDEQGRWMLLAWANEKR